MFSKLILAAALILSSVQSHAAALLCSKAHIPAYYFAERLDAWNQMADHKIIKTDLMTAISSDNSDLPFFQKWRANRYAKKLRKELDRMKDAKGWDEYDRGIFAYKFEKLAYLSDPTVLKEMSLHERNIYRQAQHTVLMEGLKTFLFEGKPVQPSILKKVWNVISFPLHPMMMRWYISVIAMPKLRGAALPPDLAMNVLWNGVNANRQALRPYLLGVHGRAYFNVFSSVYRGMVVAAAFAGFAYVGNTYLKAEDQAVRSLQPSVEEAARMAKMSFTNWASNRQLEYMIEEFKANMNRAPTEDEINQMKLLIQSQKPLPSEEPSANEVSPVMPSINPDEDFEISAPDWIQAEPSASAERPRQQALPEVEMIRAGSTIPESHSQISTPQSNTENAEPSLDNSDWIRAQ